MNTDEFRNTVYENYKKAGRTFPWRTEISPWGVMVSEFMLQQTQTERVIPYWERWMKRWPTPLSLAETTMTEALREWSGLGYNRRGRFLKDCAGMIVKSHGGSIPETPAELLVLPGIGPYASGAIACFAFNYPAVFIETNIRAVMLHFFFHDRKDIKDREIVPILKETLDRENPREWYWALMDYGVALKKLTVNPNRRSAHYIRQSRFEGSFRQMRGAVIKTLASCGPGKAAELRRRTGIGTEDMYKVLKMLEKDSMVAEEKGVYMIKDW
jgi:A/G-specific adenine glycosylase